MAWTSLGYRLLLYPRDSPTTYLHGDVTALPEINVPLRDGQVIAILLDIPGKANGILINEVGTNLIDINLKRRKKVTLRELGGCMSPIWPSYYSDASSVIFMVDASNTCQISSSCIQLLSVLAAEPLQGVSVLLIFNKRDIPCLMSLTEMKSLFRLEDIVASATQPITTVELSASSGQGLKDVFNWLESVTVK